MSTDPQSSVDEMIFNPEDFQSIRLTVHFKNLTTRTETNSVSPTPLVEIGDKTLVLELPPKSCNVKHSALVEIKKIDSKTGKAISVLSVTGKVNEVEELDTTAMKVVVDCIQYDEPSWENLLKLYSNRQSEITDFLKSIKGY